MKIGNKLLSCLAFLSLFVVNTSIDTNCYGLFYQPKLSEKLLKQ